MNCCKLHQPYLKAECCQKVISFTEIAYIMQITDLCAVCRKTMRRGDVSRLLPCRHMLHSGCTQPLYDESESIDCPLCRTGVTGSQAYERKTYAKTSRRDRELINECSNRGEDWTSLAKNLGVKYQTAYSWIRSGSAEAKKRGGARPRILSSEQVNMVLE